MKCYITNNLFKIYSLIISFFIALIFYKILKLKKTIILNYELENSDIIDKCYS
jgi:hypothetical protein